MCGFFLLEEKKKRLFHLSILDIYTHSHIFICTWSGFPIEHTYTRQKNVWYCNVDEQNSCANACIRFYSWFIQHKMKRRTSEQSQTNDVEYYKREDRAFIHYACIFRVYELCIVYTSHLHGDVCALLDFSRKLDARLILSIISIAIQTIFEYSMRKGLCKGIPQHS